MKRVNAGILPVRTVNQYRRRDVLTYLGLRYYLTSAAGRTDQWARDVATHLVLTRNDPSYFRVQHFKENKPESGVEHRPIFLPGANEALAEAALLAECAKHPLAFANPNCVFSYELSTGDDKRGIFQPYFNGLQRRHQAIAEACDECPKGQVLYIDIKRFYPSIREEIAHRCWRKQAEVSKLAGKWRALGEQLIRDHSEVGREDGTGILTGPMFSHLVGNLVLRDLDEEWMDSLPARYYRYVDDITLIGEAGAVNRSLDIVRKRLSDLGLEIHDDTSPKAIRVSAQEWLKGRNDFRESRRAISWMTLIGDLKKFMLQNSGERESLHEAFLDHGFRVPVRDYSEAVREASYLERVLRWAKGAWFRRKSQAVTIQSLIEQASYLRRTYENEFRELLDEATRSDRFNRKRRVPKLRYRASRLIYLAADETLASLSSMARELSELHFHAEVMGAVATGNIERLLPMGTNAAQAAAQPMRAAGKYATIPLQELSEANEQALAIFALNGVPFEITNTALKKSSELMRFATSGTDIKLMKSNHPFMRELACLHGLTEQPRHPHMLETVFDEDEALAMDAIEQLQQSVSV